MKRVTPMNHATHTSHATHVSHVMRIIHVTHMGQIIRTGDTACHPHATHLHTLLAQTHTHNTTAFPHTLVRHNAECGLIHLTLIHSTRPRLQTVFTFKHECIYLRIHLYECVYMYICTYVFIYVCIHVCMCIRIYVYTYITPTWCA